MSAPGLPAEYALTLYRGDSRGWQFRLWQDHPDGTPVNLPAGTTAKAEIRDRSGGALLLAMFCAVTLPNLIAVTVTSDDWDTFTAPAGVWDLQLTYPDGPPATVITVVKGSVSVHGDVTDSARAAAAVGVAP